MDAETARVQPGAFDPFKDPELGLVGICPSDPFLSVEPILAVHVIREALMQCAAPVIAVTPIIDGQAIKGPTAKIMREIGLDASGDAVAQRYAGLIDEGVIDESDDASSNIDGVKLVKAQTLMREVNDSEGLDSALLAVAEGVR